MSRETAVRPASPLLHELAELRKEWWWFLLLGLLLILSGTIAISYAFLASVTVITLFGFLLVLGGVAQIVAAFWIGRWSGFAIALLSGVLKRFDLPDCYRALEAKKLRQIEPWGPCGEAG